MTNTKTNEQAIANAEDLVFLYRTQLSWSWKPQNVRKSASGSKKSSKGPAKRK